MGNGVWRMQNREWRMRNGELGMENVEMKWEEESGQRSFGVGATTILSVTDAIGRQTLSVGLIWKVKVFCYFSFLIF